MAEEKSSREGKRVPAHAVSRRSAEGLERVRVASYLVTDCRKREGAPNSRIFLLLHGYSQDASYVFDRLEGCLPEGARILAPNGPFPLPERDREGWKVGFAWYFYDGIRDEYFIDPDLSASFLEALLQKEEWREGPVTIVGFSQGGYLAPFLARKLGARVDQVIGIGCRFLEEEIETSRTYRLDQVHGSADAIVPEDQARRSHEALVARGAKGRFERVEGARHTLSREIREKVAELAGLTS